MPYFPDPRQIQNARERTGDALGIEADSPLTMLEASVFLKYLLLEGLGGGEIRYWRAHWQTDAGIALRRRLEALLSDMLAGMGAINNLPEMEWGLLAEASLYRQRLVDLALETVLSEPLAPELCLQSSPASAPGFPAVLPGDGIHVVLFASAVFFTHEFYPLAVDAYEHDCGRYGGPRTHVFGAHMGWLAENGALRRAIYLDVASGRLVETDLAVPLHPDSVQFLCLGKQEQAHHAALSQRYHCLQVNPASPSRLADDKAATLAGWVALGLDVPVWQTVAPGDWETAFSFFERCAEIVVKPNQATEGELVAFFQRGDGQAKALLETHLQRCWMQGAAIMQQRCDGVGFLNPLSGIRQTLALRLNLAFDGQRYGLESGYAQLGRDWQHPASCGRGGGIMPIDEAISGLDYDGKPVRLDAQDWRRICTQAGRAASLFEGLLLMGLDVLLDCGQDGKIIPVFLEANPRPAGLGHSRLLADDPSVPAWMGVSLKLWGNLGLA
ncbi:hypothetical protein [Methylovulum miyakonense]|uniref:hypothetical protein n=1 Tax=Methylovulum miyakonense TaxID=645578 RepID=UPI00035D96E3|nr:hypothetical protein [Methylovulum miyakonense]